MNPIRQKLLNIINEVSLNNEKTTIPNLEDNIDLRNDLNYDSLNLAELTVKIEDEFGVDIFEDGLVFTIGQITEKLSK